MSNRYVTPAKGLDDYYAILQIPPSADLNEIKVAYKRLALVKHPDKNPSPDATAEFQLLQEAYSTLSEPKTRQAYDIKYKEFKRTSETSDPNHQPTEENRDGNRGNQSVADMHRRIQRLRSQLNDMGVNLAYVTQLYLALKTEIRRLSVEICSMLEATNMRDDSRRPSRSLGSSYLDLYMVREAHRTERDLRLSEIHRYHEQMSSLTSQITALSEEMTADSKR
ncbi:hypothetical protein N7490_002670 [Penicillium lividum]|nr:hypothetical protein N7490_002670 [Penicillium lividum]